MECNENNNGMLCENTNTMVIADNNYKINYFLPVQLKRLTGGQVQK